MLLFLEKTGLAFLPVRKTFFVRQQPPALDAVIDRIGTAGDGIACEPHRLHVARTLPGEHVRVQPDVSGKRGHVLEVLAPSSDRVTPPCPHFDEGCGGCALQHWQDGRYAAWKRQSVVAALRQAGFADPDVAPLVRTPPRARRRMDFAVERCSGGVLFGLHRAHSTDIVDLATCHVLHPALFGLLAPLRKLLSSLAALRRRASVLANLLADGADLLIRTDGPLEATDRAKLAAFAAAHAVPRIAWALGEASPEVAAMAASPSVLFAGQRVEPPPGAFLQASAEGEAAIVAAVLDAVPDKLTGRSRAVELYAGCGTISFPLASRLRVQAFEGQASAAACVRRAQAGTRVEMAQRDLVRQPLQPKELAGAAMVVLDPPYAGSAAQTQLIAASAVKRVVYVSCNPQALGREAGVLAQAGYRLLRATPIDQFLWSAQVECVAVFERA